MAAQSNSAYAGLFQPSSRRSSAIVIAVGVAVLFGWMLDIPTLKSILPRLVTMKANTLGGGVQVLIAMADINRSTGRCGGTR